MLPKQLFYEVYGPEVLFLWTALGYTSHFHPPRVFFNYLTWIENLNDQQVRFDPSLAEQYRHFREWLLDNLLEKEDTSGDH